MSRAERIIKFLEIAYLNLCLMAVDVEEFLHSKIWKRFKKFVVIISIGIGIDALLLIAAIIFESERLLIFSSILASTFALITWFSGKIFANILSSMFENNKVKLTAAGIKRMFAPLSTIALALAFVAFWASVMGFDTISSKNFYIYLTFIFFCAVIWCYYESEEKWLGRITIVLVAFMLSNHIFPNEYKTFFRAAKSKSEKTQSESRLASQDREIDASIKYGYVVKESVLYSTDPINPIAVGNIKKGQKVKIWDWEESKNNKGTGLEQLITITLPNAHGDFIGLSKKYSIPREKLSEYIDTTDVREMSAEEEKKRNEELRQKRIANSKYTKVLNVTKKPQLLGKIYQGDVIYITFADNFLPKKDKIYTLFWKDDAPEIKQKNMPMTNKNLIIIDYYSVDPNGENVYFHGSENFSIVYKIVPKK